MIPFLIANSRNTEVDGTAAQTINGYNATTLNTDANLEKIMNPIKDKSILLSTAIGRLKIKSVQFTNDEIRGERIDGLYFLLLSSTHNPKEKIKQAAFILLELFEQYGTKMKKESYTRESSLVNSLLNDYKTAKALAAIADVPQCADYIAALQAAQSNFENNRLSFETAQAQEGTQENASALKKEVVDLLNGQLIPYLNVMVQLDDATYGAFTRTLAEIISANNEVVKKRGKKDDPEAPEED